jgi:colanic acid/amylovoran biosynthesis glycosyltransferase
MERADAGEERVAVDGPVAYVMSRFPRLSETFVLYELLALERAGVRVEVYPLLRQRERVIHQEAMPLVARANFLPFLSPGILASQLFFLRRRPRAYLGALWAVLRGTWRSPNFVLGAIGIFPKVAHAARRMETEGVRHVHCHFANHPALAGFIVRRLTGIPYSFTAHGSDLHVDRVMLREKVAEAAFVATVSDYNRRIITAECGADDKVVVVRCGVDTRVFSPRGTRATGQPFRILCIGTLHEVKGQRYLVDACRTLVDEDVDVACTLVGSGRDERALRRRIAELGLTERVRLVGSRTRDQIAGLLADADVLVAPSVPTRQGKREGIPVVLMEAMASGVAVVASDLSGIPELVEDEVTGLLAPPRDAAAIAAALGRLQADETLRRRICIAGRERVERDFDVRRNALALARHFPAAVIG